MHAGPPRALEAFIAVLIPPACREEVLGDLHERYRGTREYGMDALRAVPLVIVSRIWRTTDPQILLMQAFVLYLSFLGAGWFCDRPLLHSQYGFLRLGIPAVIALLALVLEDAYARPGPRFSMALARGPAIGIAAAALSQGVLHSSSAEFAVPLWIMIYGSAMSLLVSSAVRMLFSTAAGRPQGS